jgi:7-cyano-7-deazaguanine synthase
VTVSYDKSVVLLSGGLDSATVLALAKEQSGIALALSFDYGQRHGCELQAAREIAKIQGVSHRVLPVSLKEIGGSAITSDSIAVPKTGDARTSDSEIPVTYVPARNTIFLSYALAVAEVESCSAIYLGVNALDYSGYPDCRPEFIERFQALANVATKRAVEGAQVTIEAPLIALTKAEIIKAGISLGVDYSMTVSCYDPDADGAACGACESCHLRKQGFSEADVADPTRYYKTY